MEEGREAEAQVRCRVQKALQRKVRLCGISLAQYEGQDMGRGDCHPKPGLHRKAGTLEKTWEPYPQTFGLRLGTHVTGVSFSMKMVFLMVFSLGRDGHRVIMLEPSAKKLHLCQLASHSGNQRLFCLGWLSEASENIQDTTRTRAHVLGADIQHLHWPCCAS